MSDGAGPLTILGCGGRLSSLRPDEALSTVLEGGRPSTVVLRDHERWPECGPFRHTQDLIDEVAAEVTDLGRPWPPLQAVLAIDACEQAVEAAGDAFPVAPAERVAVVVVSDFGPTSLSGRLAHALLSGSGRPVSPLQFARSVHNYAAGDLARRFGWRGPALTVAGGGFETSETLLAADAADVVVQVAVDEIGGFLPVLAADGLLQTDDEPAPDAVVPSTASAALVLTREADAPPHGVRLETLRGTRRTPATPFGCDPGALRSMLCAGPGTSGRSVREARGPRTHEIVLLPAGTAADAASQTTVVREAMTSDVTVYAPWPLLGEPFGAKATASVVLAQRLQYREGQEGDGPTSRIHCVTCDLAGNHRLVTVTGG